MNNKPLYVRNEMRNVRQMENNIKHSQYQTEYDRLNISPGVKEVGQLEDFMYAKRFPIAVKERKPVVSTEVPPQIPRPAAPKVPLPQTSVISGQYTNAWIGPEQETSSNSADIAYDYDLVPSPPVSPFKHEQPIVQSLSFDMSGIPDGSYAMLISNELAGTFTSLEDVERYANDLIFSDTNSIQPENISIIYKFKLTIGVNLL